MNVGREPARFLRLPQGFAEICVKEKNMAKILGKSPMARLDALPAAVQHAGAAPASVSGGGCDGGCKGGPAIYCD
jgi:hypothetical protein